MRDARFAVMNRIRQLAELGQNVWLDFLDHRIIASGQLKQLVEDVGISGVTSNPTIFQKAISDTSEYDSFLRQAPASESDASVLERLMTTEVSRACDVLAPVYRASEGADGFVSIEVDPTIATDTGAQVEQAVRLWQQVDRPNTMIKIPGTRAGLPAIASCLQHGIHVNVTLLFSVPRYREVLEAFLVALERRVAAGYRVDHIASVASFFVSRVDTKVDRMLDERPNALQGAAEALRGAIGIANAQLAYEEYLRVFAGDRWKRLAAQGARPQRLLWASTSSKDPRYSDTYYVDALVGPGTVDTMTVDSLRAYLDHGQPAPRLASDLARAHQQMTALSTLAIDFAEVAEQLEAEGVAKFADSYRDAIRRIARKREEARRRAQPIAL